MDASVGVVKITPEDEAYDFTPPTALASVDVPSLTFDGEMSECNSGSPVGTEPCVITRIKQLQDAQLDGHYELGADIDASATRDWDVGKGFLPIGDGEYVSGDYPGAFTGKLDGAGKAITGLFIARPGEENVGLFAVLGKESEVRELSLSGVDVTGGSAVGALAGQLFGSVHNTVVEGVEVDGRVRGEGVAGSAVGGLLGTAHESIITRSSSAAEVEGSDSVGGLVGRSIRDTIRDSHGSGRVGGFNDVGGLVGRTQGQGYTIIERSYSTADVYSRPGASSSSQNVGGLVGSNYSGTILQSFSHGQVQGEEYVGGLVGRNSHTIENSYSLSTVSGEYAVGGLVGESTSNDDEHRYIENTYSAGAVKATSDAEWVGGLIGRASEGHSLSSSYWDVDASGVNTDGTSNAEALTTAQMSDPTNFVDWDFSTIWTMADDGYPELVNNSRDR